MNGNNLTADEAPDLGRLEPLLAEYRGLPIALTPGLLDAACQVYFVRDEDHPVVPAPR